MSIIKSFSVGDGDMFYIKHNSPNFTIIDCNMCGDDQKKKIVAELQRESNSSQITRFISTHPDDDHIGGLKYLHEQLPIVNFYTVKNEATKKPECWTEDFGQYCNLRDDVQKTFYVEKDCKRKWMNEESPERNHSGINFCWPVTSNADYKDALAAAKKGESPNNISPILTYSVTDSAQVIWMGDLESSFQEKIKKEISLPSVDILFAPHHGRDSGKVVQQWMDAMAPGLVVIGEAPAEHLCYYEGYNTITQNSAGAITFNCVDDMVHIYVENKNYTVDFLTNENKPSEFGGHYLGSLLTKAGKKRAKAAKAT